MFETDSGAGHQLLYTKSRDNEKAKELCWCNEPLEIMDIEVTKGLAANDTPYCPLRQRVALFGYRTLGMLCLLSMFVLMTSPWFEWHGSHLLSLPWTCPDSLAMAHFYGAIYALGCTSANIMSPATELTPHRGAGV
jgi:hypothetical protein